MLSVSLLCSLSTIVYVTAGSIAYQVAMLSSSNSLQGHCLFQFYCAIYYNFFQFLMNLLEFLSKREAIGMIGQ